jgi:4'-phosphopantetheinyl transferase EntD
VLEEIARPEELARLACEAAGWQACIGRMLFAAKEATYKAVFPATGIVWSFDALSVQIDPEAGTFLAETTAAAGPLPSGHRFLGHFVSKPGMILAGLSLPATAP